MMTHGRGLICMPMTPDRLDELEIPLQVPPGRNTTPFDTAFCVGIEARRGVTTGISAADRATTILTAIKPQDEAGATWPGPATCFRCGPATAACWCAPGRPKRPSTWRAPPASIRPA